MAITTIINQVVDVFFIVIALAIIGGLTAFILFMRQFKHRVRIREVTGSRMIIKDDKARDFRDKDGILWWQLQKTKKVLMPVPPPEVIDIDSKGRKCVECYRVPTGEFVFAKDLNRIAEPPTNLFDDIPAHIDNIKDDNKKAEAILRWREEKLSEWYKDNNIITAFQPLTFPQRNILISQIKKALLKRKTTWKEIILPMTCIIALTLIFLSLMIFWSELAQPLLDMKDRQLAEDRIQQRTLEIIKEIEQDVQIIKSDMSIAKGGGATSEAPY